MSLQETYLDASRWAEALRDARSGSTVRLEFMLRTSASVPEDARLWLADRVRLLGLLAPGRRAVLPPALLMMERAIYERRPARQKKAFVIEAAERHGVDPEAMRKMLKPSAISRREKPG